MTVAVQLTVVLFIHLVIAQEYLRYPKLRGPAFVYRCNEAKGACLKSELSHSSNATSSLDAYAWSLRACQLRCGPAGSLWPLPTGRVRLGRQVLSVVPGELVLAADCSTSPRVRRLLRSAHQVFLRRLQAEEVSSRAQYARGRARRVRNIPSAGSSPTQLEVEVCVETDQLFLDWTVDESFALDSEPLGPRSEAADNSRVVAKIRALTFFGARHALETLAQLVTHTGPRPDGADDGHLVVVDGFSVTDSPAFPHRGLLLDTSRNYYPPAYIRATLSAMAQNKLNVLHWHITDSHSFPYESSSLPQMSAYGAQSPRETYSPGTIRELVRFAMVRGIRLLPELDAPAHVAAGWTWGRRAGLGDLVVCANQQPWFRYCIEPPCGQLNPANPHVYGVLKTLFQDMLRDFYGGPEVPVFHMGGDEVHVGCWNSSREVVDYLGRVLRRPLRRKEDFIALWGHFQERATQALDRAQLTLLDEASQEAPTTESDGNSVLRRREAAVGEPAPRVNLPSRVADRLGDSDDNDDHLDAPPTAATLGNIPVVLWTSELTSADVVEKYLDKDRYVIQLWLKAGDPLAKTLVSKGYRVIVSTKDAWYLDHGFGNWKANSTSGYPYHPWQIAYDNDPMAGMEPFDDLVLGGEAAIWGEQADPSGANTKTWPRTAAVAERLWSGRLATSWTAARLRFVRHRDRMARHGTPSEAVQPYWCTQHEGECY